MARYTLTYRGNEIEVTVKAENETEAHKKLREGHIESCEVGF